MRNPFLLLFDVAAVLIFVVAGRDTHDESQALGDVIATAAPFLLALVVGWYATRAQRAPATLRTGIGVTAITVAGGMVLRRFVYDDGTALSFVLVATAFLTLFLLGWRGLANLVVRRRARVAG